MSIKAKINSLSLVPKIIVYLLLAGIIILVAAVIVRIPHAIDQKKTKEAVDKIHATKLTLDDVIGKSLPPDPGAEADKTITGIDANHNGIRDDVELAIFKQYPDSAKTRAVLLQYALMLQLQISLPFLNRDIVTATVEDNESRAEICMWSLSSRSDMKKFNEDIDKYESFVKNLQINNEQRKKYNNDFYGYLGSYSSSNGGCDVDISKLSS
ncbi:MAG: hypothetical protein WCK91_01230 [bacterium]